jgi:AraC-like DNA-binding protein
VRAADLPVRVVAAYVPRQRVRGWVRRVASRRPLRLLPARSPDEFARLFRTTLVDAALVDVSAGEDWTEAACLAAEYPSTAFVAITQCRAADAPVIARCAALEFADFLVEGVDESAVQALLSRLAFSARFADALDTPPSSLSLQSAMHLAAWHFLVARGGRRVRTTALAASLGLTREHVSRSFGSNGTPSLKRLIDLVRVLAAAELAKNSGFDVADVARVLEFSSSAHLSQTCQRVMGRRASSLAAMRGVDVLQGFLRRSKGRRD